MKLLNPIPFDDEVVLKQMVARANYRHLSPKLKMILKAYREYTQHKGNVSKYKKARLPKPIAFKLQKHYAGPPKDIKEILRKIREDLSPDVCSMCGSLSVSTLDHIFPKTIFSEFSIFTKNLVPACVCNSKRGIAYKNSSNARILHPYYDRVLSKRLLRAEFSNIGKTPSISLKICYTGPHKESVKFHVEKVIKHSRIMGDLQKRWGKLRRKPYTLMPTLPRGQKITMRQLSKALKQALARSDDGFDTPNNWESIFFAGLVENNSAQKFLLDHINKYRAGPIPPD